MLRQRVSDELGLPLDLVNGIGRSASHRYFSYRIPKRVGGGFREIHHPARELKVLQRWLVAEVISRLPVHEAAAAYRRGKGIGDHARLHVRNSFLLRMDFRHFFPSLTVTDVKNLIGRHRNLFTDWDGGDLAWFGSVVSRENRLTIGAPTSPGLSNTLCFDLDTRLSNLAFERGVTYSRYADDLFFSTSEPDVLRLVEEDTKGIVSSLELPSRLVLNDEKTVHASRKRRRVVTGIVLTSDGRLSVGRDRKRALRTMVHRYPELTTKEKRHLAGMLAYVRSVEPNFIDRLVLKYGSERVEEIFSCMAWTLAETDEGDGD